MTTMVALSLVSPRGGAPTPKRGASMNRNTQVNRPVSTELPTPRDSASGGPLSRSVPANVGAHQLTVALTWVNRGVPVVPCSRTNKSGLVPGFGANATAEQMAQFSDPETVRAWWSGRYARAHVGLLTGRGGATGRGLVVVDCDMLKPDAEAPAGRWAGCHGGTDVLERLAREAGAEWPTTYEVITPSGGLHLYFLQPEDGPLIGCATGDGPTAPHLGPLVDVRGLGGYVIAAGSYSAAQGREYTRISPAGLMPQPLPDWLLSLLRRPTPVAAPRPRPATVTHISGDRAERAALAALQSVVDRLSALRPGDHRNSKIYGAAVWLGEVSASAPHILTEDVVMTELGAAAERCGVSRGGQRAALATIQSGWNRGVRKGTSAGAA